MPFTIGSRASPTLFGHQAQLSDTLSWSTGRHDIRFGGSLTHHTSGGNGSEPGTAILGTFTFVSTTTAPFDQLSLADVQQYTQPISYGITELRAEAVDDDGCSRRTACGVTNDLTLDLGLRYDRQTLTDATTNFAPRLGFGWHPERRRALGGSRRLRDVLHADPLQRCVAGRAHRAASTASPPTPRRPGSSASRRCLTGACLPLVFDPRTLPASQLPARDITIKAGQRDVLRPAVRHLRTELRPAAELPRRVRQPAQPGDLDRRRARSDEGAVRRRRLRAPALDRPRSHGRPERAVARSIAPRPARPAASRRPTRPGRSCRSTGGVRSVNVLTNLGHRRLRRPADAGHLSRPRRRSYAAVSYTLSKATNTTEPDGNGIGPNEANIARLGDETERGPSLLDQRHRAVITFSYQLPYNITAGTVTQLASARPFNAVDRPRQQRRRREQRPPGGRRHGPRPLDLPRHRHAGRVGLRRGAAQARRADASCCGWKGSTCSTTATSSAARRRPTATPARSTRPSARWSRSARPPTRCRRWPTSIRRGCSRSRSACCSERASRPGLMAGQLG